MMELFSGVGGTSFLCQEAIMNGKKVELRAMWAYDIGEKRGGTEALWRL